MKRSGMASEWALRSVPDIELFQAIEIMAMSQTRKVLLIIGGIVLALILVVVVGIALL